MSEWAAAGILTAGVGGGLMLGGQIVLGAIFLGVGILLVAGSESARR